MKLCYCDESGTGNEPIATMVGIMVDANRMHVTKSHWNGLIKELSRLVGTEISELHTKDFYSGNGVFRGIEGEERANIIAEIFDWLCERKHDVVYSSVVKNSFFRAKEAGAIPKELNTPWRFLGFHLILAVQKHCQREAKNKGHTIFVFDNEEQERIKFSDLIARPPSWSDEYYDRKKKQPQLDQIVDVPYFGDSKELGLVQLADFTSFFLRRHAEMKEGLVEAKYSDEEAKIEEWIGKFAKRCVGSSHIYPKVGRGYSHNVFYDLAPPSIQAL
jgi:hypothetical protein